MHTEVETRLTLVVVELIRRFSFKFLIELHNVRVGRIRLELVAGAIETEY